MLPLCVQLGTRVFVGRLAVHSHRSILQIKYGSPFILSKMNGAVKVSNYALNTHPVD